MVRYGITGFGSFADKVLAPAFRQTLRSSLVALQKRTREAADEAGRRWGCRAYTDAAALVRDPEVDAIFSAGLNSTRCRETLLAAEAGKHALVEKPMAMDAAECRLMIDACRRSGVQLMVAHVVRFSPAIRKIREIVQSGRLGTVTAVRSEFVYPGRLSRRTWLRDRRLAGGGPLYDLGVHCIDTIRYVLDRDVELVRAVTHPAPTPDVTESSAVLALRCGGSALASVLVSFECGVRRTVLEVLGTEGVLTCLNFTRSNAPATIALAVGGDPERPATEEIVVPVGDLYVLEIDHFSGCILDGTPPLIPGEEGLRNQLVLDAAMAAE